jgi:hypothetical protein
MSMLDVFNQMNEIRPFETAVEKYTPPVVDYDQPNTNSDAWLDRYATFQAQPRFNPNFDGYLSPYASGHWGASSDIMQSIAASAELGPLQERVDPNKIFTSDIAALKTLAADQIKIVKVFERRLMESLNDKGKFGLNEDDIEALQALTSARSAITQINKEQIAIKKSIAELKIKQQQTTGTSGDGQTGSPSRTNAFDVGRSIMDHVFDMSIPVQPESVSTNYPSMDLEQAASVLNDVVTVEDIPASTLYEADKPVTYVVVGDSDSDAEYVTVSSVTGQVIPNFPNPTSKIQTVDRTNGVALDEFMVEYKLKTRDEI